MLVDIGNLAVVLYLFKLIFICILLFLVSEGGNVYPNRTKQEKKKKVTVMKILVMYLV